MCRLSSPFLQAVVRLRNAAPRDAGRHEALLERLKDKLQRDAEIAKHAETSVASFQGPLR